MYQLVRSISFMIRAYLCYCTIDTVSIIKEPLIQELILEFFSMYTLLWACSYFTNRKIIREFEIHSSTERAILYFFIYLIYLFVLFGILKVLTWMNVLPL